jgi:hypothetical protein
MMDLVALVWMAAEDRAFGEHATELCRRGPQNEALLKRASFFALGLCGADRGPVVLLTYFPRYESACQPHSNPVLKR